MSDEKEAVRQIAKQLYALAKEAEKYDLKLQNGTVVGALLSALGNELNYQIGGKVQ